MNYIKKLDIYLDNRVRISDRHVRWANMQTWCGSKVELTEMTFIHLSTTRVMCVCGACLLFYMATNLLAVAFACRIVMFSYLIFYDWFSLNIVLLMIYIVRKQFTTRLCQFGLTYIFCCPWELTRNVTVTNTAF